MPHKYRTGTLPGYQEKLSEREKRKRKNASSLQEVNRRFATAARPGQKPNVDYMHHPSFTLPIARMPRSGPYRRHKPEPPERPPVSGPGHKRPGKLPRRAQMEAHERESESFFRSPAFHMRFGEPAAPPAVRQKRPGNTGPRSPEQVARTRERIQREMEARRERERHQRPLDGPLGPLNDEGH